MQEKFKKTLLDLGKKTVVNQDKDNKDKGRSIRWQDIQSWIESLRKWKQEMTLRLIGKLI